MSLLIGMEGATGTVSADDENLGFRLALRDAPVEFRCIPRTTPDSLVPDARRLIDEGVFMLLNFYGGKASNDIAALANERGVPYMFPHTFLLPAWPGRYVFSSYPRPDVELRVLKRHLAEQGWTRIAVLGASNDYGALYADALATLPGAFVDASQPDSLVEEMRLIQRNDPHVVFLALYPAQARKAMEAKASLGWDGVRFAAAGPLADEQFLVLPDASAEGLFGFCYYPDPATSKEPGVVAYREAMELSHPGYPLNRYSLYGYVHGLLILEGLKRTAFSSNRDDFIRAMESLENWDAGGIIPPVTFGARLHHAQFAGRISEIRGGRFVPISGWVSE